MLDVTKLVVGQKVKAVCGGPCNGWLGPYTVVKVTPEGVDVQLSGIQRWLGKPITVTCHFDANNRTRDIRDFECVWELELMEDEGQQ